MCELVPLLSLRYRLGEYSLGFSRTGSDILALAMSTMGSRASGRFSAQRPYWLFSLRYRTVALTVIGDFAQAGT